MGVALPLERVAIEPPWIVCGHFSIQQFMIDFMGQIRT
ncbi:hypothetical protein MESS4_330090 [Mesorhizobium sp. STM 4661]|nr:hypothetical protein MESS4_330090 [Mesorhizobium sp. STM 4661]